jgi:hypothetical protein
MGGKAMLVLLAVVGGLAALLLLTDEKPRVDKAPQSSLLQGRSLADCTLVRWQFHERQPIELGRAPDGRFQLREPIVDIASAGHMRQIIGTWDSADMRAAPIADDEAGRANAGLAPPELVLTAQWADGPPLTIEVGAPGPLGTTRFLRVHGRIWEGGAGLIESLRVGLDDLRERVVFKNAFAHANDVRVATRTATGKLEAIHLKLEGGEWRLLEPVRGRADPVEAQRFVTAVLDLRVDDFQLGPMKAPETEPFVTIDVAGGGGQEHLELWQAGGQFYGQLPGRNIVFLAGQERYANLFENAAERLRARMLLPIGETTFAEVVEIVVDPGQGRGDRVRLAREGLQTTDWRLVEPVDHAAAPTPCSEALQALQLLVAREFVDEPGTVRPRADDARYGLQPAQRVATSVRRARDQQATTLWFGADGPSGGEPLVYACRADDPDTVVLVQKANVAKLRRPWTEYCALQIVRQPAGIDRLDLGRGDPERPGYQPERTFQVDDGKWHLAGSDAERSEVGELVANVLVDLHGAKAVDARGDSFARADWWFWLMRRNGDGLDRVEVWDRGPEQPLLVRRVQKPAVPVAFELRKLDSTPLRALWQ